MVRVPSGASSAIENLSVSKQVLYNWSAYRRILTVTFVDDPEDQNSGSLGDADSVVSCNRMYSPHMGLLSRAEISCTSVVVSACGHSVSVLPRCPNAHHLF